MTRVLAICCALPLLVLSSVPASAADRHPDSDPVSGTAPITFHVAPGGSDRGPGSRSEPFATIGRARDAIRPLIAAGLSNDVTVEVHPGRYHLDTPLEFTHLDSGTSLFSITYHASSHGPAVISGGRTTTGWTVHADGTWTTSVPASRPTSESGSDSGSPSRDRAGEPIRELFVNGVRRPRARHPNAGYLRVKETGADRRTGFTFDASGLPFPDGDGSAGNGVGGMELVFLHDWSTSRVPVRSITIPPGTEKASATLITAEKIGPAASHYAIDHFERHPRFYLENSRAYLDEPGEWIQESANLVRYFPMPDEDPARTGAVVPVLNRLLTVRGTDEEPVWNLHFVGLQFEHCAWPLPSGGYAAGQATYHERRDLEGGQTLREPAPAAIVFEHTRSCSLRGGAIRRLGGSGIHFGRDCRNGIVADNHVHDVSGNGVMIGEDGSRRIGGKAWWIAAPDQSTSGQRVEHNLVEHCGTQFFGAVGVWIGLADGTRVVGNEIRNLPYTGVSVGWMWNPTPTPCRDNHVSNNHIHHVMQILSDGGGIYTLGRQPGSRLTGNVIHDVPLNLGRAESNGMFLDEGTTGMLIAGNLIYATERSPLRFHRATVNLVRDNTFIVPPDSPVIRYNNTDPAGIHQRNNRTMAPDDLTAADLAARSEPVTSIAGPRARERAPIQDATLPGSDSDSDSDSAPTKAADPDRAQLEEAFAKTMNGAVFQGRWCLVEDGELGPERDEKYTVQRVQKIGGDQWLVFARIQYGRRDLVIPVPVHVKWAGDTPVISVTDLGMPGLGTYTARVVVHGDMYGGTWSAPDHGGLLHGQILRP